LLVLARTDHASATYAEILTELDRILDGDIALANSIHVSAMGYKSLLQLLIEERKLYTSWFTRIFWRNALEIIYAVLVFRYHFPAVFFDATRYAAAIDTHSDFRKVDDLLRMVVDCSSQQAQASQSYLEAQHADGEIYFGVHFSDEALMTCFVYGMSDSEHIHFVDAGARVQSANKSGRSVELTIGRGWRGGFMPYSRVTLNCFDVPATSVLGL